MIIKILIVFIMVIAGVALYAFTTAPKVFVVSRSIVINASAAKIFPYVNNPRKMEEWNPFTAGDATVKLSYSGPEEGVGAQSAWEGNSNTGIGQATITESERDKGVAVRLDFKKPFEGVNYGAYQLEAQGDKTLFVWTINENSLIPRLLSRILNLDKMIGTKFESDMAKLKSLLEG
ncbi:MAG: SRPBCC family protein [Chitinophagaceae bacterium]|nr:SRPBCC family protein [Oligoflexus sp.]